MKINFENIIFLAESSLENQWQFWNIYEIAQRSDYMQVIVHRGSPLSNGDSGLN